MSRPADQMQGLDKSKIQIAESSVSIVYDASEFQDYPLPIESDRDLTQREIFEKMVFDIIVDKLKNYSVSPQRLEAIIDESIKLHQKNNHPLIDWDSDNAQKGGHKFIDVNTVQKTELLTVDVNGASRSFNGYLIRVKPELQAEIANKVEQLSQERTPEKEAYFEGVKEQVVDGQQLAAKLDAVADWSRKHELHGMTSVFHGLMKEAGPRARSLKEFLTSEPTPLASEIKERIDADYRFLNVKGAREKSPQEIVAVFEGLDQGYKKVADHMVTAIGFLPGVGKPLSKALELGLDARNIYNEVQSGDVTLQQALKKRVDKAGTEFLADQISSKFGGKAISENVGVEAIKNFAVGTANDFAKKSAEIYRKGGSTNEYKEALATSLVENFAKSTGKSITAIAGDDESVRKLIEGATGLGIEKPVKMFLEQQKELSKPAPGSPDRPQLQSQAIPVRSPESLEKDSRITAAVADQLPSRNATEARQVAVELQKNGIRDKVDIQQIAANKDQTVVFGMEKNAAFPSGFKQTSAKVEEAIAMDLRTSTEELARMEQASVQQVAEQAKRSHSIG